MRSWNNGGTTVFLPSPDNDVIMDCEGNVAVCQVPFWATKKGVGLNIRTSE